MSTQNALVPPPLHIHQMSLHTHAQHQEAVKAAVVSQNKGKHHNKTIRHRCSCAPIWIFVNKNVVFLEFHRRNGQINPGRHHQDMQSTWELKEIIRSEGGSRQRNDPDDASGVSACNANSNWYHQKLRLSGESRGSDTVRAVDTWIGEGRSGDCTFAFANSGYLSATDHHKSGQWYSHLKLCSRGHAIR